MKRFNFLFITVLMVMFSNILLSQSSINVFVGLHSANTHSTLKNDLLDLESINRVSYGVIYNQNLDRFLSLRTGLIYRQNGFQVRETYGLDILGSELPVGFKAVAELNTFEMPLMLQYNIKTSLGIDPYLSAGPSLSYAKAGVIKTKATAILDFTVADIPLNLASDNYNRLGLNGNITIGTKINYGKGHFITEVGYSSAMTDLTSESFIVDTGLRPKGWSYNIGYGLSF